MWIFDFVCGYKRIRFALISNGLVSEPSPNSIFRLGVAELVGALKEWWGDFLILYTN